MVGHRLQPRGRRAPRRTVRGRRWGHGYATEIGAAALTFAFETLDTDEVVAFSEPHNTRSRAVMDRLSMAYARDIVHDDLAFVLYTIDRDRWRVSLRPSPR